MKNIKIYNKQNKLISDQNYYENENDFIDYIVSSNYFGKPERWVLAKELLENGNPEEPEHWMWQSEYYEDSDVLETEERFYNSGIINQNEDGSFSPEKSTQKWVKLKADYTIEIIDLDTDYDWLLSECHRKRKEEYPKYEDYLDGLVKGDEAQKQEYINKCLEVKSKYPKPTKESN